MGDPVVGLYLGSFMLYFVYYPKIVNFPSKTQKKKFFLNDYCGIID